jgi:hypothetical protein
LKKDVFLTVQMLVGMQDIATMFVDPTSYFCHDARLVWAV